MMPVSKMPPLEVAECGVGPLLVQVTVSPTLTVTLAGENWKSLIVTPVEAAAMAIGFGFLLGQAGSSSRAAGGSGAAGGGRGLGGGGRGRGGRGGAACAGAGAAGSEAAGAVCGRARARRPRGAAGRPVRPPGRGCGSSEADSGAAIASAATTA